MPGGKEDRIAVTFGVRGIRAELGGVFVESDHHTAPPSLAGLGWTPEARAEAGAKARDLVQAWIAGSPTWRLCELCAAHNRALDRAHKVAVNATEDLLRSSDAHDPESRVRIAFRAAEARMQRTHDARQAFMDVFYAAFNTGGTALEARIGDGDDRIAETVFSAVRGDQ